MIRAVGCSRRARRIAWRACRSASAVTAQVLTIIASASPAVAAARRITSLSAALRRQPKVITSTAIGSPPEQGSIETAVENERRRPGHQDVAVLFAELDVELTAIELDSGTPAAELPPVGCDQSRA